MTQDFLQATNTGAKPTFWGWDAETWTAIGTVGATVAALGLAILGAVWKPIRDWSRRPRFTLLIRDVNVHSELVSVDQRGCWQLRLPVFNKPRRDPATNVEVFLARVEKEPKDESFTPRTYLPVRLLWSHAGGALCKRIPADVYRLLDFGKLWLSGGPSLTFDTEIPNVNQDLELPAGAYILEIIIAADRVTTRYRVRARIQDKVGPTLPKLADLLQLELMHTIPWGRCDVSEPA
jgi:hypothetical protein